MQQQCKKLGQLLLPRSVRLGILRRTRHPPVGRVNLGDLRRLRPISRVWGGDRGLPVDRFYIEAFLASCADDIQGRVLEVGDNTYTRKFGAHRVTQSDVVHAEPGNPMATFVADFADAPNLPAAAFDCVICTQTLQFIPDIAAAIDTLYRILKPGGVVLVTVPGISQLYRDESQPWKDYWRFTSASASWLFAKAFMNSEVTVTAHGNVLAAVAFLHGLAAEELQPEELTYTDPHYELLITIRAVKSVQAS